MCLVKGIKSFFSDMQEKVGEVVPPLADIRNAAMGHFCWRFSWRLLLPAKAGAATPGRRQVAHAPRGMVHGSCLLQEWALMMRRLEFREG